MNVYVKISRMKNDRNFFHTFPDSVETLCYDLNEHRILTKLNSQESSSNYYYYYKAKIVLISLNLALNSFSNIVLYSPTKHKARTNIGHRSLDRCRKLPWKWLKRTCEADVSFLRKQVGYQATKGRDQDRHRHPRPEVVQQEEGHDVGRHEDFATQRTCHSAGVTCYINVPINSSRIVRFFVKFKTDLLPKSLDGAEIDFFVTNFLNKNVISWRRHHYLFIL